MANGDPHRNGNGMQADADDRPVTVYKVGGSLFDWPPLFERLSAFLESEHARPLIVSGGGGMADVVRGWDRVHDLGELRAHRLAIASLSMGGEFLADGLGAVIVRNREHASAAWAAGNVAVLDARFFLEQEAIRGIEPLPASWNVTSDSIAAWIAGRWPAKLVLLKSVAPHLADAPYVDAFFDNASQHVRSAEWVDLRSGVRGVLLNEKQARPPHAGKVNHAV